MNMHIAEYVSPGHPDRLADAIVESVVDLAVSRDPEALVGVECAVHTDHVFIDGRIAAGRGHCAVTHGEIEDLARDVYRASGYGGLWKPAPEDLRVIQNVCLEPLSDEERAIRQYSDDQNVVSGYACDHPETDYLPPAHFIARYIGRKVDAWRRTLPDKFGPDFKVLVHFKFDGARAVEWKRLTLSIQHAEGVYAQERHELVTPVVREALAELEARGLRGIAGLRPDQFVLNGAGDFIQGGPEGDNGLSGKKLAVDFYGPEVRGDLRQGPAQGRRRRRLPRARPRPQASQGEEGEGGDGAAGLDARRRFARLPRGGGDGLAGDGASDSRIGHALGRLVLHLRHRRGRRPHGHPPPRSRAKRLLC